MTFRANRKNNTALRKSAEKIRKSSGYGGLERNLNFSIPLGPLSGLVGGQSKKIRKISESIIDNIDGALSGKSIKKKINKEYNKEIFDKCFTLYLEDEILGKIPAASKKDGVKKFAPNLSVKDLRKNEDIAEGAPKLQLPTDPPPVTVLSAQHVDYTPNTSLVGEIEVFANAIPTVELSRCVPYLDVQFFTAAPTFNEKGQPVSISLAKAAVGAESVSRLEVGTRAMAQGVQGAEKQQSSFGMEMFTTPQTFVPLRSRNRAVPVLDQFRPYMSIKSFDLTVVPGAGLIEKTKGSLNLVLHDRSRLHEISELIRPDNYGSNEILIEYGWSHPDATGRNEYANFINSMRSKEKYAVLNSNFRLNQDGEVDINLTVMPKGIHQMMDAKIIDNPTLKGIGKTMGELSSKVRDLLKKSGVSKKQRKEITAVRFIDEAMNDGSNIFTEDFQNLFKTPATKTELDEFMEGSQLSAVQRKQFKSDLEKLIAEGSKFTSSKQGILKAIMKKLFEETPDPFYPEGVFGNAPNLDPALVAGKRAKPEKPTDANDYITVGKLLTMLVGRPLASTNKFTEVQLMFYGFSEDSGFNADVNSKRLADFTIDQFLISKSEFQSALGYMIDNNRSADIPVMAFITYLINNFIKYPFSPLVDPIAGQSVRRKITKRGREASGVKISDRKNPTAEEKKKLKAEKQLTAKFRTPNIQVRLDSQPEILGSSFSSLFTPAGGGKRKTILRIHVFDGNDGAMTPYSQVLSAGTNTLDVVRELNKELSDASKLKNDDKRHRGLKDVLEKIKKQSGITGIKYDGKGGWKLDIPFSKLKQIIAEGYPTFTYGADGSILTSAGFSSIQNQSFNNVMLKRFGRNPNRTALGTEPNGLPLMTQPGEAAVSMFGCPLIRYAQHFFFDFGTGTNMDDLYYVKSVRHRIQPGTFTTDLSLMSRNADGSYESMFSMLKKASDQLGS